MKNNTEHNRNEEHDWMKDVPGTEPFKAPEGYFDDLSDRISSRLTARTSPKPLFPRLAVVGSLAAVVIALFFYLNDSKDNNHPSTLAQESSIAIDELEENISLSDFDDNLIVETLVMNDASTDELNEWDDAEDYLIENNVELSLIISEL